MASVFVTEIRRVCGMHRFLTAVRINDREFTDALCLHVTDFCEDICKAAEKWLADVGENPDVRRRVEDLLITDSSCTVGGEKGAGALCLTARGSSGPGLTQVTLLEDNFKNFRGKIIDVGP